MNMRSQTLSRILIVGLSSILGAASVSAAKPKAAAAVTPLSPAGKKLEAEYSAALKSLQADIQGSLPKINESLMTELQKATEVLQKAEAQMQAAQKDTGKLQAAKGAIDHAKGKWIGGAEKGIAKAQNDLKNAKTDAERDAANKELAHWQANKEDGLKALKERQAAFDEAKRNEAEWSKTSAAAKAELDKAKAAEQNASNALLKSIESFLASDKLDAKLMKGALIAHATPAGLAEFAQQGKDQEALTEKLLSDPQMMKDMLLAGGARYGKYGRALDIYNAIQKASPKAKTGNLQRLALATSLVHATPVDQSKAADQTNAPSTVDPVNRYLHYEKAFLANELDPAFKNLTTWEYRHVINSDAPDAILTWGREMLRTYRPDHIYNPDYGWRYVSSVRTEVPYGSQNQKYDLPSLHQYQNIIKDGGICGRRAFYGRFILQTFGIPTWGVTQHAHAALSHWTPSGWVVNLGAGYAHSWWEKDEVPLSGNQFLLETQARAHAAEYTKVLRAQWVSRILGEEAYNERKKIAGGFWSRAGLYQSVALATKAVALGPLGQELGEANESDDKKVTAGKVSVADQKITVTNGTITIPSVLHGTPTGKFSAMKSIDSGMQIHALGGFKAEYTFDAPRDGNYSLSAQVATAQEGQKFLYTVNGASAPIEFAVPYTTGLWQKTQPIEVSLKQGKNTISLELATGSRGVTIKEFTLSPAK